MESVSRPGDCAGPLRVAVLISGGGTTLRNLLAAQARGELPVEFRLVLSSRRDARGLEYAHQVSIPTFVLPRGDFPSDAAYGAAIFDACRTAQIELVVMGGFLKFVPIPADFEHRVVNIHPGLIPAFCGQGMYGHHVHAAVLAYGAKLSGCTVHFVDNQYDHGPIILQHPVVVLDDDTPETLAARIFEAECAAYPEAIRRFAAGRLEVVGRVVRTRALPPPMS